MTAIKESADAVAVELTSSSERPPQTLIANYLIGCDGARSFVRRVIQWLSRRQAQGVLLRPDRYGFTLLRTNADLPKALGVLEQHLIPSPCVKPECGK